MKRPATIAVGRPLMCMPFARKLPLVASPLQAIGIALNPAYAEIARQSIQAESTLFAEIEVTA